MRTEANARAALALLERIFEEYQQRPDDKFLPEVLASLAGEINAMRYMLREEPPGPGTLEGLLLTYARYFEVEDAKAEAGVTP